LIQKLHIRTLNWNSKNLKKQEKNTKRKCNKCGEEKPLNKEHFQVVEVFKEGYSFYCNSCDKPIRKD
jgi:predicted RNA-binding Zn-ribbon protein involved in translation (DUF1610 family)